MANFLTLLTSRLSHVTEFLLVECQWCELPLHALVIKTSHKITDIFSSYFIWILWPWVTLKATCWWKVFFWVSIWKPLSPSSFTLIKRLFSSFSLSASRVVSAYLRLLIFIPAILILACESSSPGFHMIYSACKLNNRVTIYSLDMPLLQFWTSLLVPCPVLTVTSCPVYRFLRRQIRWSGIPISLRIFHSLSWST